MSLSVSDAAVRQHGRLVHLHSLLMKLARVRQLFQWEKIPCRTVDDFIGSVAEDIDDGIGGVEDAGVGGEIYGRCWSGNRNALGDDGQLAYREWR